MLTVAVDSDGVVCDLEEGWLRWYKRKYDYGMTHEQLFDRWEMEQNVPAWIGMAVFDALGEGVFRFLNPYEGALDALNKLNAIANVYIVTSANGIPSAMSDKAWWYKDNTPFIDVKRQLVIMNEKFNFRADIMIDDRLENIAQFLQHQPKGKGVYIRRHHGRNDIVTDTRIAEASSLAEAIKLLVF